MYFGSENNRRDLSCLTLSQKYTHKNKQTKWKQLRDSPCIAGCMKLVTVLAVNSQFMVKGKLPVNPELCSPARRIVFRGESYNLSPFMFNKLVIQIYFQMMNSLNLHHPNTKAPQTGLSFSLWWLWLHCVNWLWYSVVGTDDA